MALLSQQLQRFVLIKYTNFHSLNKNNNTTSTTKSFVGVKERTKLTTNCSAIAIDAQSSALTGAPGIRWGSTSLQGPREEMEDAVVVRSDGLDGFLFAAVFDGHGGFSSAEFLRDELYKECCAALKAGLLLTEKRFNIVREALEMAFQKTDNQLLDLLALNEEEDESGTTATVMLVGSDVVFISHIGDSCVVLSRSGKAEELTSPHRPYGSNKVSLQEIKRIREAGGWIVNGRICGDIAVSRAFGDQRFKTKKNEMVKKGIKEGRWSEKFASRVQFSGDLVTSSPDVFQVTLGKDAEFLLLASDGLWDYMNSSEAVDFVREQLRKHGDVQMASEALAQAALDRRTQDNVSVVIADLGRTDWRNLPVQKQNVVLELGQALATIGIVSVGIWITSLLSS